MTRYRLVDQLRGLAVISMIVYHAMWDLVYLLDLHWAWYHSGVAYIWQQSICWCFILLSGFSWSLGKRQLKRGMCTLFLGGVITLVTTLVLPEDRVSFGVLTLLGSATLLMIGLDKLLHKCSPLLGLVGSGLIFIFCRNINNGYLGFERWQWIPLPRSWYHNVLTTYLGFPMESFYSSDYFSLFPWLFLFIAGYFLYRLMEEKKCLHYLTYGGLRGIEWIGKHAIKVYLVHQPLLYLGMNLYLMMQHR